MHRFRLFYSDSSEFGQENGAPERAPFCGVIAIVQDLGAHVQVLHQADFYWLRGGQWWAGDIFGFVDQAARFGASWVKQGQTVHPQEYSEILGKAVKLKAEWDR